MLVLTDGRLIDGTGREPIEKTNILIEGNRISNVGSEISYPEGASVIDLKGLTIMPGLIDCHLHLGGFVIDEPGRPIGKVYFRDFIPFLWDYLRNYARRRKLAIENGVTTIRSAGDNYPHITQLRDKIETGRLTGPRIFTPGPIFTAPGGHPAGTIYKRNRYVVEHATRQVGNVNTARDEVKKLVEGGVDCIKAIYSKIDPMDITHEVPRLDLPVLEAIVDEAHRHNLRTMVHTGTPGETRDAVSVGADSIEHGIVPGTDSTEFQDDLISMMLDRKTHLVPTLAIAWAYQEMYPDFFYASKKLIKQLHVAGINISLGTDSGAPGVFIGRGAHIELEAMVEAGLSPMEAIIVGTKNAAENLDRGNELGTIEKGKLADMVVVSGDPLKNITDTRDIKLVIKDGKVVVNRLKP